MLYMSDWTVVLTDYNSNALGVKLRKRHYKIVYMICVCFVGLEQL